ncbi:MAG TPA: hypothetical protein VGF29_16985 [Hyphomicrobiaceae bacterium]|jgi:hypothetical protein
MASTTTTTRTIRIRNAVHAALVEAARVEGTNPNRIAATAVEAWLAQWLAQRAAEARAEARGEAR